MTRQEYMLAALSGSGQSATFQPVHVQKLFFLIDREIAGLVGGPHFDFRPYDYGPFDSSVYSELDRMSKEGLIVISKGYYRSYRLTDDGFEIGQRILKEMDPKASDFIERVSKWIRRLSFSQLVSAIYKRYPDMKAASVFRD